MLSQVHYYMELNWGTNESYICTWSNLRGLNYTYFGIIVASPRYLNGYNLYQMQRTQLLPTVYIYYLFNLICFAITIKIIKYECCIVACCKYFTRRI